MLKSFSTAAPRMRARQFADVVGDHALRGAAGGKLRKMPVRRVRLRVPLLEDVHELRERQGHVHALLVLHAEDALLEDFLLRHLGLTTWRRVSISNYASKNTAVC